MLDQAERDVIEIIKMIQRDYQKQIEPYVERLATLRSLLPAPPIVIDASVWQDLHIAKVANERSTN
jgi:hypothetical protein